MGAGAKSLELPPRTRRILPEPAEYDGCGGTTSAYAENTITIEEYAAAERNYLRVRGEYRGLGFLGGAN